MTRTRRHRPTEVGRRSLYRTGLAALLVLASSFGLQATTTERIVANRHSGIAIDGYDPVAYFVDGTARQGRRQHEHSHGGVAWRFRNEGNQAAFARDPLVYMPCFGGYDPVNVARGVATPGHPVVFAIVDDRLCLFFSEAGRRRFLAAPRDVLRSAKDRWPKVREELVR